MSQLDLSLLPEHLVDHARALDGDALGCVPALRLDETWESIGLELQPNLLRQGDAPWHYAVAEQAAPAVEQHQHGPLLDREDVFVPCGRLDIDGQLEPIEAVRGEGQQIGQIADGGKRRPAEHFHRHSALERRQIEFDRLGRARQIGDAQDAVIAVLAQIGEDLAIAGLQKAPRAAAEGPAGLAHGQHPLGPAEQRTRIAQLRFDIDRLDSRRRGP